MTNKNVFDFSCQILLWSKQSVISLCMLEEELRVLWAVWCIQPPSETRFPHLSDAYFNIHHNKHSLHLSWGFRILYCRSGHSWFSGADVLLVFQLSLPYILLNLTTRIEHVLWQNVLSESYVSFWINEWHPLLIRTVIHACPQRRECQHPKWP